MKTICYSALLLALILLLSFFFIRKGIEAGRPNDSPEELMAAGEKDARPPLASVVDHAGLLSANRFSSDAVFAMNSPYVRSCEGLYELLRSAPPAGMKIGKSHMATVEDGQSDEIAWHKRTWYRYHTKAQAARSIGLDEESVPFFMSCVLRSPSGAHAIASSGGVGSMSYLLKFDGEHFDAGSARLLPSVNYDDPVRRWTIRWEAFLTDRILLGVMREPDVAIENPVRAHYYLYDVPNQMLSRLGMPVVMEGSNPAEIEATSDSAILVHHGGSYHTVIIQGLQ